MRVAPEVVQTADEQSGLGVDWRLGEVARRFDEPFRERVSLLLRAAAETIAKLGELSDLVRFEADGEQGGHTLALWEELAPVVGSTVEYVNEVISGATAQFPSAAETDEEDDLDAAFGPSTGEAPVEDEPRSEEEQIASLVAAVCSGMRGDVTRLGDRLRNPTVMSDPWMLIQDLLEFRGRVRAALGELIYQVASLVMQGERENVVPGYVAEVSGSLLVRQATTNLAFLFRGHAKRTAAAADDRILSVLQDALKDVHAFSRTRALPQLRTSDKRIFLETRATLYRLAKSDPPSTLEIRQAVENLARFLDSLSVVSRRESLRLHDRAQLARAGRHLEAAQVNLPTTGIARRELADAVKAASALYGRDAQLDAYIRSQRHFPGDWLNDPELSIEISRLRAILGGVAPP
jgi:hypothetical protein